MPEILHDPRLLAPTVTSIGIVVTLFLFWLNQLRTRKELSYEIVASSPFSIVMSDLKERLPVSLEDTRIEDLHVVLVKVTNSGNVAIRSNEYEGKVTIWYPEQALVHVASVQETRPANLDERSVKDARRQPLIESIGTGEVVLRPVLMNRGDYVKVLLLVENPPGDPQVVGHVEGIHDFKKVKRRAGQLRKALNLPG